MDFKWETLWLELCLKAPLLLKLLQHAFPSKRQLPKLVLCTIAAILSKQRNQKMCCVQAMNSIVLQAGHAGKQVWIYSMVCIKA